MSNNFNKILTEAPKTKVSFEVPFLCIAPDYHDFDSLMLDLKSLGIKNINKTSDFDPRKYGVMGSYGAVFYVGKEPSEDEYKNLRVVKLIS